MQTHWNDVCAELSPEPGTEEVQQIAACVASMDCGGPEVGKKGNTGITGKRLHKEQS